MKYKNLYILLIFFFFAGSIQAQKGNVKGKVFNAATNEPIPFANVVLYDQPSQGAATDINGNFTIAGVEPGYHRLIATYIGFEKYVSADFLVTPAHPATIMLPMQEISVKLKAVEIRATPFVRRIESPVSLQTLSIQEIERSPGANRDISRVIQNLPGVASTPAYRNDIIVRGGGPAENRFYLDGVEIPNINHFATQGASGGPVGIINADFIREVDFYAGAFPAGRGNALSSVMEFRQVDGNQEQWNFRASVGATDLALTSEGPLSPSSNLLFSVRRSYLQFLFDALGLPFLPTYNDYQMKLKWSPDQKNQFTLISLGSLDESRLNTGLKNPDESQRYILGFLPENLQWSYTIGGVWRHFRQKGSDTWVLSRNMLDNRAYKYLNNVEIPENKTIDYESQEIENKFRYEAGRQYGEWKVAYGLQFEQAKYFASTYQRTFQQNQLFTRDFESSIEFWKWGTFTQVSRSVWNNRLALSAGLRTDANTYSVVMENPLDQLSPRVSASLQLSEQWYLNMNTGRYFQLPPYTSLGYRNNDGVLVNRLNGIRYLTADHHVAGVEFRPDPDTRITLEGFYKVYKRYPLSVNDSISLASKGADYGVYGDEAVFSSSRGRTYGMEMLFRDKDLYGWNVLASLTLVRSEFTNVSGDYLPSNWDNKLLFNVTLFKPLKHNWNVGMKWRYVGGTPYTPYDLETSSIVAAWDASGQAYLDYGRFNAMRLPAFHQLDIRIDKAWYFSKWSLMLYMDVQNLYNFKAVQPDFFVNYGADGLPDIYIDPQGVERYRLRAVKNDSGTILPTIGIMVEL
ncbi:MAG TPA: TonB-dependent receptor [Bacteroidales bacterium]|nr:TonB-dependent receptor [Bacteroidales bacterium]HSA42787.1 TonB-dependent receptor [Bacteroidales bacterium]